MEFNEKFSLPIHGIKSVFEVQPEIEKINLKEVINFFPRPPDEGWVWVRPQTEQAPAKKPGLMFQLLGDILKNA